ncbi:diaminopimelate decarboxylase [Desulfoplanes formicivorans]|uniref:Diaminopimelate decarboxylase n=1 Tax=Desulfoplanes formicivorans TaxID=1592317 RepID=A0A194AGQ8_9BACT|nr:diaminopimelate decarboxylase [Desulfoplanes formicivorans]GAU09262.1 diaminopimelate decarboxylase [Desulfoplanes formicivorans]
MNYFKYKDGELHAEDVRIRELAEKYGTPLYVYSAKTLQRHFKAFDSAFEGINHLICYSVKANSNLSILNLLKQEGSGVDIVSGGELFRALRAGIDPKKIVYSGVGKSVAEIQEALFAGILMFNVESEQELERISKVAVEFGFEAQVSLRINPDVDPKTHPYIATGLKKSKFGIPMDQALPIYVKARDLPGVNPVGIDCHIGSQLTTIEPFLESIERLKKLHGQLAEKGIMIKYLDLGGGLGITYDEEEPPHPREFGEALKKALAGMDLTLILEPGRVIAGNAGILVTQVEYIKQGSTKDFVIVDAGMNDLIRPSLYGSFHRIAEVEPKGRPSRKVDVVGPICESGDFLAQDRELPQVQPGELLAVHSAGAYGFVMSSQYNSRPRAAEILVDGATSRVIRKREQYQTLVALEEDALEK